MTQCDPGDVVLVRFPFTDLTTTKQRPTIVSSPSQFVGRYGDVLVMALTSRPQAETKLRLEHWTQAGLPKPTWIKPLIATVSSDIVIRRLGALAKEDWPRVHAALQLLVAQPFLPR